MGELDQIADLTQQAEALQREKDSLTESLTMANDNTEAAMHRMEQAEAAVATLTEALRAAQVETEKGLNTIEQLSFGVDVRDKHQANQPVTDVVVRHSDAMHALLFVRSILDAALRAGAGTERKTRVSFTVRCSFCGHLPCDCTEQPIGSGTGEERTDG